MVSIDMKFGCKLKDHIRNEHVGLAKVHKALYVVWAFSMIVKTPQPLCSVWVLSTPGGPGLGPGSPLRRSRSRRLDPGGGQLGGERGQETSCRTQGGHTTARTPGTPPPPGAGAGTITSASHRSLISVLMAPVENINMGRQQQQQQQL